MTGDAGDAGDMVRALNLGINTNRSARNAAMPTCLETKTQLHEYISALYLYRHSKYVNSIDGDRIGDIDHVV